MPLALSLSLLWHNWNHLSQSRDLKQDVPLGFQGGYKNQPSQKTNCDQGPNLDWTAIRSVISFFMALEWKDFKCTCCFASYNRPWRNTIEASPVGVLMDKQCEAKKQKCFQSLRPASVTCRPPSPLCFHINAFRSLAHLVMWNADLRCDVSRPAEVFICIWNSKLQKNKKLNLRRTQSSGSCYLAECSLWIQEWTRPDARGEAWDKNTVGVQRSNVQRSSNWARGWHFVKRTWIHPYSLDIKRYFFFYSVHDIQSCVVENGGCIWNRADIRSLYHTPSGTRCS